MKPPKRYYPGSAAREEREAEKEADLQAAFAENVMGFADECMHCGKLGHADNDCPTLGSRATKPASNPYEDRARDDRARKIATMLQLSGLSASDVEHLPVDAETWKLAAAGVEAMMRKKDPRARFEWHNSEPTRLRILEILREREAMATEVGR